MEFAFSKITIGIVAFIAFGLMLFLILPFSEQSSTIIIDRPSSSNVTFNATIALDDLTDVIIISPATNQTLIFDGTNWVNADIVITGNGTDATSCNNLGSGVIICAGGNVNLKSLLEGNGIDLGSNSTNIQISNSGVISNIAGNGISVNQSSGNVLIENTEPEDTLCIVQATGISLCVNDDIELKNLIAGSGIEITTNSTHITFTATSNATGIISNQCDIGINCSGNNPAIFNTDFINGTGVNIIGTTTQTFSSYCNDTGSGEAVCESGNNINSIIAGTGIAIGDTTGDLTIINSGVTSLTDTSPIVVDGATGEIDISCPTCITNNANVGNGANVFKNITASVAYFKTLLAGSGISVANGTDTITFTNTGVTSITATSPIVSNSTTGAINLSCPTCLISTSTFAQWEKLCQTVLGSSATTISCSGFGARQHLYVNLNGLTTTSTMKHGFQVNSDTGANYAWTVSVNGGAFIQAASTNQCMPKATQDLTSGEVFQVNMYLNNNIAGNRKIANGLWSGDQAVGVTFPPQMTEFVCMWGNTSAQITTITFMVQSGTGVYNTNTELTVWGYN